MFKILKVNKLPAFRYKEETEKVASVVIVDFSPHLLSYLLSDIIATNQVAGDVAYSLAYKTIKAFECHNQQGFMQKLDLS